ncbi:hypothetical protein JCM19294_2679 [Nonlabens tegetincola]|uniref:Uncharacterized protein n=1 Tax=Nonlabens tegetincola TaxID=323273 RepID=A0A090Q144_9FLAO|nr:MULTISPECIES: hypothetical protein [Nonlabens]ALM21072.1 hypothetical protein AAT17_07460 [Nonlabens sp. MIC269]ARN72207.1 hypothetical protein BST91_11335 [Nonlabens tegetincola]MEE2801372.1 hypothetical protein [Bacteroidota bacterium]GAK95897.1 hypothetical protein JCM19294_2679 [Nonlabens tegetincola]
MKKEASIIIHQLRTAVHPEKKLMEIWRELDSYEDKEKEQVLNDLDSHRQEIMANGDESFGEMLEKIITDIRIGVKPPKPKIVPKQF